MNRFRMMACAVVVVGIAGLTVFAVSLNWSAKLIGYEEVPALSNDSGGVFRATISEDGTTVNWELIYAAMGVTQAHLHFGQAGVNGGISVFLCTNLGNGPAGTQPCPANGGMISGIFSAADVIGPAAQGIGPGELNELVAAVQAGIVYANIHTTANPGGAVRGQVRTGQAH